MYLMAILFTSVFGLTVFAWDHIPSIAPIILVGQMVFLFLFVNNKI